MAAPTSTRFNWGSAESRRPSGAALSADLESRNSWDDWIKQALHANEGAWGDWIKKTGQARRARGVEGRTERVDVHGRLSDVLADQQP
eukprot:gene335-217_t